MTSLRLSDHPHVRRCAPALAVCCAVTALASLTLASCDNGCEQIRESYPHLALVSTSGRVLQRATFTYLGAKQGMESKSADKFSDIELYVNPNDSLTTVLVECSYTDYGDHFTSIDTLTLRYSVEPRFLDLACGCTMSYTLHEVLTTHQLLANVHIDNADVHTSSGINITIEY